MKIELGRRAWLAVVASVAVAGTALLVLAGLSDAVRERDGLTAGDGARLHWFIAQRSTGTVDAARVLTGIGGVVVLVGIVVVAGILLWRRGLPLLVTLAPSIALALTGLAVSVGQTYFGRARPDLGLRLVSETEPSFPSGHSADSTAVLLSLGLVLAVFVLRRPLARAASVAFGVLAPVGIGLSRLVLGVHWPTDVVAGWALGGATAVLVVTATFLVVRITPIAGGDGSGGARGWGWRLWRGATRVRRSEPSTASPPGMGSPIRSVARHPA
ncbi:MAG: phosphatase PAP2 family protein [Acidimicrobiales bacterium]